MYLPLQTLSRRSSELESLKAQWNAHATTLSSEHSVSLSSEREKALQTQSEMADRFAREKRETEELHTSRVRKSSIPLMHSLIDTFIYRCTTHSKLSMF